MMGGGCRMIDGVCRVMGGGMALALPGKYGVSEQKLLPDAVLRQVSGNAAGYPLLGDIGVADRCG